MALSIKLEMSPPVAAAAGSTNGNQQDEACSPYYAFQDNEPLVRNQESTETTSAWESECCWCPVVGVVAEKVGNGHVM